MENLAILEAFELFIEGTSLTAFQISISCFIIIAVICITLLSLNEYHYDNLTNAIIAFLTAYVFISLLTEIMIYFAEINIQTTHIYWMILGWKIIIAIAFVMIVRSLNRRILLNYSTKNLFKVYDYKVNRKTIDSFMFIIDQLIKLNNGKATDQEILSLIYTHKDNCLNDKCKCHLIQIFQPNQQGSNEEMPNKDFVKMLISRIGFLIETSFVQIDYTNCFSLSLFLAEYFYIFKTNPIMAYSIIQTYFHTNLTKMSVSQTVLIYSVSQKYLTECNYFVQRASFDFSSYYKTYRCIHDINKRMLSFCESYNKMIQMKETFEGSIKVNNDYDTGEISKITSSFLTSKALDIIIDVLRKNASIFGDVIQKIIDYSEEGHELPIEYYFKVYLFFNLFNSGKIPKKIRMIIGDYIEGNSTLKPMNNRKDTLVNLINMLYLEYEDKMQSSNIIVKFAKGFKIEYFSEKLACDLGFVHTALIGEDLDIIIPKKIRDSHHQSMINFLIVNHNYNFTHESYIFTANGHTIPCNIKISTLPGIAKNLVIVCNVILTQKDNQYSFILNEAFEAVALSDSFEKKYAFGIQLVNTFDINLLEIFDIPLQAIQRTFSPQLRKIEAFKRSINVSTVITFSQWLFNTANHNNSNSNSNWNSSFLHDDFNLKKFKVLEEQRDGKVKNEDILKSKMDIELFYSRKKLLNKERNNTLSMTIPKSIIAQNLIRLITKFNEMEAYDERYKKLNESLYKFRLSMRNDNEYNPTIRDTSDFVKAIALNKYHDTSYYSMKIFLRGLYDKPIYIVKINEVHGKPIDSPHKKSSVDIASLLSYSARCKNKDKDKQVTSQSHSSFGNVLTINTPKLAPRHLPDSSTKNSNTNTSFYDNNPSITHQVTNKMKIRNILYAIPKSAYFQQDIRNQIIATKVTFSSSNHLLICLFICLIASFILTFISYMVQNDILATDHLLFQNLLTLYYQRDKLLNLYCTTITILYKVANISLNTHIVNDDMEKLDNLYSALKENAKELDNGYHLFYSTYLDYKDKRKLSYDEMLIQKQFAQIKLNWIEIKYLSDYFSQMQYLSLLYNKVIYFRDNYTALSNDVDQFLFDTFLLKPEQEVESEYGRLLYYLGSNYIISFEQFFDLLIQSINVAYDDFHSYSINAIVTIETIVLCIYVIYFSLVLYYLYKHNNIIFKSILKMFIYSSPGEEYSYKNYVFNYSLKLKISTLMNLLSNFTIDNLTQVLLHEHYNKIQANFNLQSTNISQLSYISVSDTNNSLSTKNVTADKRRLNMFDKKSVSSSKLIPLQCVPLASGMANDHTPSNKKDAKQRQTHKKSNSNISLANNTLPTNSSLSTNTNINILLSSSGILRKNSHHDTQNNPKNLTKSILINHTHNAGVNIVKNLALWSMGLFIIYIIYYIVNLTSSLKFLNDINEIFIDFSDYTNYYSLIYIYFNELRIKLISPTFIGSDRLLDTMTETIDNVTREINILINSRLSIFPEAFNLLEMLNGNYSSLSSEQITLICHENELCINIYNEGTNEILSKGINMGVNAMFLQITNLYRDYNNVKENEGIKTVDDIRKLLANLHFSAIEETLDFVLNNVKESLYDALDKDESYLNRDFLNKIDIFTYIPVCYCIFVMIMVMSVIIFNIQRNIKYIVFGSYKFNQSFYYSHLIDCFNSEA